MGNLRDAIKAAFPNAGAKSTRGDRSIDEDVVRVSNIPYAELEKFLMDSGKVRGLKEYTPKAKAAPAKAVEAEVAEEASEAAEAEPAAELLTQESPPDALSKVAAGLIGFCVGSGIVYAVF